jgi:hypothetical protein
MRPQRKQKSRRQFFSCPAWDRTRTLLIQSGGAGDPKPGKTSGYDDIMPAQMSYFVLLAHNTCPTASPASTAETAGRCAGTR